MVYFKRRDIMIKKLTAVIIFATMLLTPTFTHASTLSPAKEKKIADLEKTKQSGLKAINITFGNILVKVDTEHQVKLADLELTYKKALQNNRVTPEQAATLRASYAVALDKLRTEHAKLKLKIANDKAAHIKKMIETFDQEIALVRNS